MPYFDDPVRLIADHERLTDPERAERTAALSAIRQSRLSGLTVETHADDLGLSMSAVSRWAASAVGADGRATATDDLFRLRPLVVDDELVFVETWDPDDAEEAMRIFRVQWDFVNGYASADDVRALPNWFDSYRVENDPRVLNDLARRGEFDVQEQYRWQLG
jgi:hypothetical protein